MTMQLPAVSRLVNVARRVRVRLDDLSATVEDRLVEGADVRDLQAQLSAALYEVYHAGQRESVPPPRRLRDPEMERRLADGMPHRRTTVRVTALPESARDTERGREVLVVRDGVRVWVPESIVNVADEGALLTVPACRPAVSPGFFLVHGSVIRPPETTAGRGPLLRVYVHLGSADQAIGVWSDMLGHLESRAVPYQAKVLSAAPLFPRRDALVVYLAASEAGLAQEIADVVSERHEVPSPTSAFAEQLVPGVGVAWEPADPRRSRQGMSFGQHRAAVTAQALLDSAQTGVALEEALGERLREAGVDPVNPARNIGSPDLP
ncbi:T3SS effector HopA1 family protein [Streptosporangium sp. NPDC000396]|uniref:T3SS effector HopA1 family protein n=1 Tax=Streptosporangium sp. NPDC000396 TaxID=3366185 RepID=UPI0036968464